MARLLTQFGEASVMMGGQEYLIRPSFKAIAGLGDSGDIAEYMQEICMAFEIQSKGFIPPALLVCSCANLIELCSTIPSHLLGFYDRSKKDGRPVYIQGKIPIRTIVMMANHCIQWGVHGDPKWKAPPQKKKHPVEPRAFDPADFVSILIDEFHISRDDAWSATMTEFQRLCEQRLRNQRGDKPPPPSEDAADKAMQHARDAIKRAREMGIKPKKLTKSNRGRKNG